MPRTTSSCGQPSPFSDASIGSRLQMHRRSRVVRVRESARVREGWGAEKARARERGERERAGGGELELVRIDDEDRR